MSLPRHLDMTFPNELAETAAVVRAGLRRFDGRPVLLTTAEGVPFTNGRLVVADVQDGGLLPTLVLEFSLRGVMFAMEVPLGRVFALAGSWTGDYFVYPLPPGDRLFVRGAS